MEKRINIDESIELDGIEYWAHGEVDVVGDALEDITGVPYGNTTAYIETYEFDAQEAYPYVEFFLLDEDETPLTNEQLINKLTDKVKQLALNYVDFID